MQIYYAAKELNKPPRPRVHWQTKEMRIKTMEREERSIKKDFKCKLRDTFCRLWSKS